MKRSLKDGNNYNFKFQISNIKFQIKMAKKNEKSKQVEEKDSQGEKDKELEECLAKIEEFDSKYKRAIADYQNLEKRVIEQRRETILSANRDLLLRLLPILDTLELALRHEQNQTIQISINQFVDILKAEGVTKIETVGKKFDPYLMEAIESIEGEDGQVIEEVQAGYMMYDKLLRPAMVKVGG